MKKMIININRCKKNMLILEKVIELYYHGITIGIVFELIRKNHAIFRNIFDSNLIILK